MSDPRIAARIYETVRDIDKLIREERVKRSDPDMLKWLDSLDDELEKFRPAPPPPVG